MEFLAGVFFCASSCYAYGCPRRALPRVTLRGLRIFSGSICLSCSCGGAVSVVFALSLVQHMFSVLSLALPMAPAGLCSSPYHWLPFRVSASFLLLPAGCCSGGVGWAAAFSLVFSVLLLRRMSCRCSGICSLYRGSAIMFVTSPCMAVWWCLTAPRAFRALLLVCQVSLASGWMCCWPAVSGACVGCTVCAVSAAFLSWVSFCCACCPPPALAEQVVWSQSFTPSCCSWRLCSLGVSAAVFCPLAILSHPLLLLFLAWVSSSGFCSSLGW